jgi:hypothetical protein
VARDEHETLDAALEALDRRVREIGPRSRRDEVQVLRRHIQPVNQVAARIELAGPQRFVPAVQGGIDLRGDGSAEAYTGHWRRRPVELRDGESATAGLARVLRAAASSR